MIIIENGWKTIDCGTHRADLKDFDPNVLAWTNAINDQRRMGGLRMRRQRQMDENEIEMCLYTFTHMLFCEVLP